MSTSPTPTRSAKRMRLGTKSCTECRRRKVRCVFHRQGRCQQCITHGTRCESQDVTGPGPKPDDSDELRARLESMEEMLRMVCRSQVPTRPVGSALGLLSEGFSRRRDGADDGDGGEFVNAPLIKHLRDTVAVNALVTPQPEPLNQIPRLSLSSIQHLIPDGRSLRCILQATQRFWSIWPLAGSMIDPAKGYSLTTVQDGLFFVEESLASSSSGTVVKCLAWLCLCLQQLPKNFEETTARLPLCQSSLVCTFLDQVDSVVLDPVTVCDMNCLEAMILQYKAFVNMGRPRRAWKCTRNAIDHAIMLGLNRNGDGTSREAKLWTALWQQDRHLSLFLGLSYTVPEPHIKPETDISSEDLEARIFHRLNIICGHIIDRDLFHRHQSYAATARIVEEMDELEAMIPDDWKTSDLSDTSVPLGVPFWHQGLVLLFHFTNQLLHLPLVRHRTLDKRNAHSEHVAYQSAENILTAYRAIRTFDGVPIICDFLDFCAFGAALVLAVDLAGRPDYVPLEAMRRRWALIDWFSTSMRRTASALDCSVAAQAANVLESVYAIAHGTYNGPEVYQVIIPFFGPMTLKKGVGNTGVEAGDVQFSSSMFDFRVPDEFVDPSELGRDWVAFSFASAEDWIAAGCP